MTGIGYNQVSAINASAYEAVRLIEDRPDIADMYRGGKTREEIAGALGMLGNGISTSAAISAVTFALTGGVLDGEPFEGLMSEQEAREIASKNNLRAIETMRENEEGIFNLESRRKAGGVAGRLCYQNGTGVFSLSDGERAENSRKGVLARGIVPWTRSEIFYVYVSSKIPSLRKGRGVDTGTIADHLNNTYHSGDPVRNKQNVSAQLCAFRKKYSSLQEAIEALADD